MKSNFKKAAVVALAVLLPLLSAAQTPPTPTGPVTTVSSIADIIRIIENIIGWLFAFLMLLTTVFVLYAAFLYLTAAGDEKKLGQAKTTIIYAVIAVVVALLSRAVVFIVAQIVK